MEPVANAMKPYLIRTLMCLCAVVLFAGPAAAQTDDAALIAPLKAYHFGDNAAPLDAISARVRAVRSDPVQRPLVARKLAAVLDSEAAVDAKQFVCRQLVFIAGYEQIPALAKAFRSDDLVDFALAVLVRIPGKASLEAIRRELPRSKGRSKLAIVSALGDRRDPTSVTSLTPLLHLADPALAAAAAHALGKIGDRGGILAVEKVYRKADPSQRTALGDALLIGADRLRDAGDGKASEALYESVDTNSADPRQRAAALRGVVSLNSDKAVDALIAALDEDGTPRQSAAADVARQARFAVPALCHALATLHPTGRLLAVEALGDRGDATAAPYLMALYGKSQGPLRIACLRALCALDASEAHPLILMTAAQGTPEEQAVARDGLTELRGRGVDAWLVTCLDADTMAVRVETIRALGQRRVVAAVPRLVQEAKSPQREESSAAVRVLRELGRPEHLPTLVALLLATPAGDRDDIANAITDIARRGKNETERTSALIQGLGSATQVADRKDLLSALADVSGPAALNAMRTAAADPDAEIRTHALGLLAEWPTDEPMDLLLSTARGSQETKLRRIALRGYIRMVGLEERWTPEQSLARYKETAELARDVDEKRLIVSGLARLRSLEALDYAADFEKDPALKAEAELAAVEIAKSTLGAWRDRTKAVLDPIAADSSDETVRTRVRDLLNLIGKFGDFVTAWEVSPAYDREGMNYSQLFDLALPPEMPGHEKETVWRVMPAGTDPQQPWLLDLLALWGGEQRVAYLRTSVWSERACDLVLELGSDDGVKAWWNGAVVIANNTQRAVAPGQDKVKVSAKPGWNALMLKIPQNVMGWGACARFTNPDGSPAAGLRFAVPSDKEVVLAGK